MDGLSQLSGCVVGQVRLSLEARPYVCHGALLRRGSEKVEPCINSVVGEDLELQLRRMVRLGQHPSRLSHELKLGPSQRTLLILLILRGGRWGWRHCGDTGGVLCLEPRACPVVGEGGSFRVGQVENIFCIAVQIRPSLFPILCTFGRRFGGKFGEKVDGIKAVAHNTAPIRACPSHQPSPPLLALA